jgi:hypothetical protein
MPGRAIISGSLASDSASRVAIEVSVVEKHAVLQVNVDPPTPKLALQQSIPLKARVTMADGQINGNVTWGSSDSTIAAVNPTTGEVTALREGRVTIVASYAADPRYKGLAEIEITKEAIATPKPAPSDAVVKPGVAPDTDEEDEEGFQEDEPDTTESQEPLVPAPNVTTGTVVRADSPSQETVGKTTGGNVAYKPPSFSAIREFSRDWSAPAVFEFIDFRNVVVAEGTKLTVTSDGGRTWTTYPGVGSQTIRALHWPTPNAGWVAGDNGTILKVQISNGELSFAVKDSGSKSSITGIYFTSSTEGVIASNPARRTTDGGETWQSIGIVGSTLHPVGVNGVAMMNSSYSGNLFHYRNGGMEKIETADAAYFRKVRTSAEKSFVQGGDSKYIWYATTNWTNFTPLESNIRTPTQILRDALIDIYPITKDVLLAAVNVNYGTQYVLSQDGGKVWSDPGAGSTSLEFIKPFSETEMWAIYRGTLYRAGTP